MMEKVTQNRFALERKLILNKKKARKKGNLFSNLHMGLTFKIEFIFFPKQSTSHL